MLTDPCFLYSFTILKTPRMIDKLFLEELGERAIFADTGVGSILEGMTV